MITISTISKINKISLAPSSHKHVNINIQIMSTCGRQTSFFVFYAFLCFSNSLRALDFPSTLKYYTSMLYIDLHSFSYLLSLQPTGCTPFSPSPNVRGSTPDISHRPTPLQCSMPITTTTFPPG